MENIASFFGIGYASRTFADGYCHQIASFANCCVIETPEGLVVYDIAQEQFGPAVFTELRNITEAPIRYLIYSHGHFDHCFGYKPFIEEIDEKGWEKPQIIAHENVLRRWEKYRMLDNYHAWLNLQQFASVIRDDNNVAPSARETLDPTVVVSKSEYTFQLGGLTFNLFHELGETDDALWLWFPEKEVIFSGDLIISGYPNVGNPYKVQRYPKQWAIALERMREKSAKYLAPGHGELIEGKDKVEDVLSVTSEAMHFVHDEVVARMNQGKWFDEIYYEMLDIYPEKFRSHPYLRPIYGCYEFAIHAVYRQYHGWYNSGNPTHLFPAKSADIAAELLKIGSATQFMEHVESLVKDGKLQLALHIIDQVIEGVSPQNVSVEYKALKLKSEILQLMIEEQSSFITTNIIRNEINLINLKLAKLQRNL